MSEIWLHMVWVLVFVYLVWPTKAPADVYIIKHSANVDRWVANYEYYLDRCCPDWTFSEEGNTAAIKFLDKQEAMKITEEINKNFPLALPCVVETI